MSVTVHSKDELRIAEGMAKALGERLGQKYDIPQHVVDSITADIYSSGAIRTVMDIVNKRIDEYMNEKT